MSSYKSDAPAIVELDEVESHTNLDHVNDIALDATKKPTNFSISAEEGVVTLPFKQLIVIFIALSLAIFLASLDQTIVATALPIIASDFNALNDIAWVATSYLLTTTSFQPLYGKFSDIFGRKVMILFAILVFLLGSALCGASTSMTMLIISRAIQGLGGGGLFSMVIIIVSDVVALRDRGKYTGIIGAVFALSSVIGPIIGGVLTDNVTWRWCFYINLPVGAVTVVAIAWLLHLPVPKGNIKEKIKQIDYLGAILLVACMVAILLATSWGGHDYPWVSGQVLGLYGAGLVLLIAFIWVEVYWAPEPIVPPHLFTVRNVALVFLINFLVGTVFLGLIFFLPIYFQVVRGSSATESGLLLLPLILGLVVFSIASGVGVARTGHINIFIQLGTAITTIGSGLLYLLSVDSTRAQEIGFLLICGVGIGLHIQTTLLTAHAACRMRDIAVVSSLTSFFRTIGGVFGVAIFGAVFNNILATKLVENLAGVQGVTPQVLYGIQSSVEFLRKMPPSIFQPSVVAYVDALRVIFLICCPIAGLSFIVSLTLKHKTVQRPGQRHSGVNQVEAR